MALQYSTAVRDAQLDAYEATIGASPVLRLYSGAAPANCAAAATGTLLLSINLPADWMAAASGGSKAKSGTWAGAGEPGAGAGTTAGYYRIWDATLTTCHEQGTITATGGGGDMTMDNANIASGQSVTVTTKTQIAGNA